MLTCAEEKSVTHDPAARPQACRVLLVEDDLADAYVVERQLARSDRGRYEVTRCDRIAHALDSMADSDYDVVLLDLGLPDGRDTANVSRILEADLHVPIIVLTGLADDARALDAVRRGAQEYLVKGEFDENLLLQTIRHAIERQRLIQELHEANQRENEVKDRFLSHVSHELRTPLTAIYHFVTILRDGLAGDLSSQQTEYLGVVHRNVEQLKQMIADLMEVTRIKNDKVQLDRSLVAVTEVASEAIDAIAKRATEKAVQVDLIANRRVAPVAGDPVRLKQVFLNLLENAVKFTPENGKVTVSVNPLDTPAGGVEILVEDSGCGLPEGECERVFSNLYQDERGQTGSRQGLGLGLFITKEIVSRHGGEISAANRPEGGARFRVTVPCFSLADTIRRVFGGEGETSHPLALITASVLPASKSLSRSIASTAAREVVRALQDCTIGATDVVLPFTRAEDGVHSAFVLARTDDVGAHAIEQRVRTHLESLRGIRSRGLSTCVTSEVLETGDLQNTAEGWADLARSVENHMQLGPTLHGEPQ